VNQPKRLENAKVITANTSMDTDKIKVFGSKVRVDSTAKIAELELAEKVLFPPWCSKTAFYRRK
jgi:T-complex protein 1 subunit beta